MSDEIKFRRVFSVIDRGGRFEEWQHIEHPRISTRVIFGVGGGSPVRIICVKDYETNEPLTLDRAIQVVREGLKYHCSYDRRRIK